MKSISLRIRHMGMLRTFATATLLIVSLAVGCRKVDTVTGPDNQPTVTTTILGEVHDESGAPLQGVTISASGQAATTDANGLFEIVDAKVRNDRAFVIAKKSGYYTSGRAAIPSAGGATYMKLSLAQNVPVGTITGSTGGKVMLPSGAALVLAPSGVVTSTGATYAGQVSVSAKHLDPSTAAFSNLFPGDLTGQQADGSETQLQTYGVMVAELHAANGDILQPAPGHPATITIPIAASQRAAAPSTLPLWYFDETLGMWKEEGSATRTGNTYVGTVQHFSAWNYDWKGPWGTIKGRIVCNDVPLPGVTVDVGTSGQQPVTNGAGEFEVKVPAETNNIKIEVIASENNGNFFTTGPRPVVVPRDVTTDVGDIALNSLCPSYLQGFLKDCNNEPIPGMIIASYPKGLSYVYTKDGSFKIIAGANSIVTLAATATTGVVVQPKQIVAGDQGAIVAVKDLIACPNAPSDIKIEIAGRVGYGLMAFSPDGSKIAAIDTNRTDVLIYDVNTGNLLTTIPNVMNNGYSAWTRFSPDGMRLMTYYNSYPSPMMDVWNVDGSRVTPTSLPVISAVFGATGNTVILSDKTHTFEYDLASKTELRSFAIPSGPYSSVILVALTPGAQIVAFSQDANFNSNVYVWDMASNSQVRKILVAGGVGHDSTSAPGTDCLSPDGTILGTNDYSYMHFYNLQTGLDVSNNVSIPYYRSYAIAGDDATFLGSYRAASNSTIGFFKMTDGSPVSLLDAPASMGTANSVALSIDGKLAAGLYQGKIRIWKLQ